MQTKTRVERLLAELKEHLHAAEAIAANAEDAGRDLTDHERRQVQEHFDKAKLIKPELDQARRDEQMKSAIYDLGAGIGLANDPGGMDVTGRARSRRPGGSQWAKAAVDTIEKINRTTGQKAVVSGSIDVAEPIAADIVTMAAPPLRLLDLVQDRRAVIGSNTFSYVRQTVRTNNAATVPDGAAKPVSINTVIEVEDRCRVVAHISEDIPQRLLADHESLRRFLESEMEAGLLRAVEQQLISGDGLVDATHDNWLGVLNTSGTIAQPYDTSPWVSIRKGLTSLEVVGETPNAIVVHPADAEEFDLAREGAEGGWLLATPPGNVTGGLPLVRSTAVPAGTAVVGDWNQLQLVVREEAKLDVDTSGDRFTKNLARIRLEGRYCGAVLRTTAFCEVDLTPA